MSTSWLVVKYYLFLLLIIYIVEISENIECNFKKNRNNHVETNT